MANRFLSLHRAALLIALLPVSAQAAGLKSTTEETVKALTAINIPVQNAKSGIHIKTEDNFIVIVKSEGNEVRSIEYTSLSPNDAKSLAVHQKTLKAIIGIAVPIRDETSPQRYLKDFFDKAKETPYANDIFTAEDGKTGQEVDFASVIIRYKPKTGAFLFRLDAIQPQGAAAAPPVAAAPKPPVATALRPTLNEALAMSVKLKTPLKKIREGEYMSTPAEYFISVNSSGQKVTEFAYTGQFKAGSDENINHIVRAKLFLDFFVPGLVEGDKDNEAGQMLMDIAKSLGKPPERTFNIGHGIDVKSHYFDATGLWVLTAKPQ